jgi:glutamine amidotransferase
LIAIIDYGVGNLSSVEKALNFIGCKAVITNDTEIVKRADGIVLPGVGAFDDAMKQLDNTGMTGAVKTVIAENKPFLGICLGMQLLFEYSEESNDNVKGLGILKGSVKRFRGDMGLKVPHMGWNSIETREDCPLFKGISGKPYVYFVHSYFVKASDRSAVAAVSSYGIEFDAAVGSGNIFATQFHPEKSGNVGLEMLKNFARVVYS